MSTQPAAHTQNVVLVVEDDVLTRAILAEYLRHCGYRVFEAADSDEAARVVEHPDWRVDVILSAVEIRGSMDGFALSRWIRDSHPHVDVILAGSPRRAADAAGDLCENGPDLQKPYEPSQVVERIRRLRGTSAAPLALVR
jgi:DNA-binding response OmpR family regulator